MSLAALSSMLLIELPYRVGGIIGEPKTIPGNSEWWADNINEALNQFLDVIGG